MQLRRCPGRIAASLRCLLHFFLLVFEVGELRLRASAARNRDTRGRVSIRLIEVHVVRKSLDVDAACAVWILVSLSVRTDATRVEPQNALSRLGRGPYLK